jgi:hypothetical protein
MDRLFLPIEQSICLGTPPLVSWSTDSKIHGVLWFKGQNCHHTNILFYLAWGYPKSSLQNHIIPARGVAPDLEPSATAAATYQTCGGIERAHAYVVPKKLGHSLICGMVLSLRHVRRRRQARIHQIKPRRQDHSRSTDRTSSSVHDTRGNFNNLWERSIGKLVLSNYPDFISLLSQWKGIIIIHANQNA